jgi:hypothetical protein
VTIGWIKVIRAAAVTTSGAIAYHSAMTMLIAAPTDAAGVSVERFLLLLAVILIAAKLLGELAALAQEVDQLPLVE